MSHYFETPSDQGKRREIQATIWGDDYTFTTAPGVFSGTRLDLGTSVLLRSCEAPTTGRVLDLGCGFGPIAVAIASAEPDVQVDAVDVNELAVALTNHNAKAAGVVDRVSAFLAGQEDPDVRYDEIWSNPPIRIGKQALHDLLLKWLPRLAPNGRALLVVGKNLGADSLQTWLREQEYTCERLASAKGFRVFEVRPAGDNQTR